MSHGKRITPEFTADEFLSREDFVKFLTPYKSKIAPLPFFLFLTEAVLATICSSLYGDTDSLLKMAFGQLLAINSAMAGLLHFFPPMFDYYTSMIFVPFKRFWLYITGLGLLVSALGLAFSQTQVYAAWCLVSLFVLMLPGNLACVFMEHPRNVVMGGSLINAILRLPVQALFIRWALWFTSPPLAIHL